MSTDLKPRYKVIAIGLSIVIGMTQLSLTSRSNAQSLEFTFDVYTAFVPPYAQPEPDNKVSGTLVSVVSEYMKGRQLNHKITLLPWSAAYRRTELNQHALLFPVDRTPEREDAFHWIKSLAVAEYYLYGIAGTDLAAVSLDEAIASDGLVTCGTNSIQCQILTTQGFENKSIVRIEDASVQKRYELMMNGRNQYTVFDPKVYEDLTKRHGLDPNKLVKMHKISELNSYLAANKDMPTHALESLFNEPD
ncbi:type 2 periplasmic-binding domain-containing protein [Kordiimonas aquimaris]|uniref:hypothetical protein n=1 Tax=Kordiimonas aquimaris TaxID=707591 RepID=UPI0021D3290A|nr:hypothetical protein [Kordiimonas aquimaris]